MFPDNRVSQNLIAYPYINQVKGLGEFKMGYELGGLFLQNPEGGLFAQLWIIKTDGERIFLQAPNTPEFVLLEDLEITEVDLAFDQSMFPFVTYVSQGVVKFYWYDTETSQYLVSILSQFAISPRCTLDDKREFNRENSDIVLFYIDPIINYLCFRLQRDRYEVIYLLEPVPPKTRVRCVNFCEGFRLQWTLDFLAPAPSNLIPYKGMSNFSRPISTTGEYKS